MHHYLLSDPLMRTLFTFDRDGKKAVTFIPLPNPVTVGEFRVTAYADVPGEILHTNYWDPSCGVDTALDMFRDLLIKPERLDLVAGDSFEERYCNLLAVANERLELSLFLRTDDSLLYVDIRSDRPNFDIHVLDKAELYSCHWSITQHDAMQKLHERHYKERQEVEALFNPLTPDTPSHLVRHFKSDKD